MQPKTRVPMSSGPHGGLAESENGVAVGNEEVEGLPGVP